ELPQHTGQVVQRLGRADRMEFGQTPQRDGLGRCEVLIKEQVAVEIPAIPVPREEDVGLYALRAALIQRVAVVAQHLAVRDTADVHLEPGAGAQHPILSRGPDEPRRAVLEGLLHEEARGAASLLLRQDVAILEIESFAEVRVHDRRKEQILAVVDGPEERRLRVGALARRVAELREQESGLALATDGGGEDRDERNQWEIADPERRAGAVDELVEIGRAVAEAYGPVRRIGVAGREHTLLDAIDALPQPLHALAADSVIGRTLGRRLIDDPGPRLDVVLDALPGQLILAVVEDDATLGDGIAGGAIELDAIGHQSRGALDQLDVAGGDQEVVGADLLEL